MATIHEGLREKGFHGYLYLKRHPNFNEFCLDSMDYDGNFEWLSNYKLNYQFIKGNALPKISHKKNLDKQSQIDLLVHELEKIYQKSSLKSNINTLKG